MGTLTDVQIRNWIKTGKAVAKSDGNGLTFTMSVKQAEQKGGSWVLRYRLGGKARELTLGRYPDMSLTQAREQAAIRRLEVQKGVDVAAIKQQVKRGDAASLSVSQLFREFFDRNIAGRWKDAAAVQGVFDLHILPILGAVNVAEVRPAHIDAVLHPL